MKSKLTLYLLHNLSSKCNNLLYTNYFSVDVNLKVAAGDRSSPKNLCPTPNLCLQDC